MSNRTYSGSQFSASYSGAVTQNIDLYNQAVTQFNLKEKGNGWANGPCPLPHHNGPDKNPSFGASKEGGYNCFSCGTGSLAELLGVSNGHRLAAPQANSIVLLQNQRSLRPETIDKFQITDNEDGYYLYPVECPDGSVVKRYKRYKDEGPKYFWERGKRGPVYNLKEAEKYAKDYEGVAWQVEGEADTWTLSQAGVPAISFFGCGDCPDDGIELISNSKHITHINVLYDKDEAGIKGANKLADKLRSKGVSVSIVNLPEGLPVGSDISNLYVEMDGNDEAFRERLLQLPSSDHQADIWPEPDRSLLHEFPASIPLSDIPDVLLNFIRTMEENLQVSSDWLVLKCLTALSVCSAGIAKVRITDTWEETLSIYGVTIADPSERKSAVFKHFTQPIYNWQERKAEEARNLNAGTELQLETKELYLKGLKSHAGSIKAKLEDREESLNLAEITQGEIEGLKKELHHVPDLLKIDVTSQGLVQDLANNDGRIGIFSPEGLVIKNIDGRNDSKGRSEATIYCNAYNGETLSESRVTREGNSVKNPALTIDVMLQPSVLDNLKNKQELQGEGFLARNFWVKSPSRAGKRKHMDDLAPLNLQARARYHAMIETLLNEEVERDEHGIRKPKEHSFTANATQRLKDFEHELDREKLPLGKLAPLLDWGGKLHGHAVRIAVHLARADRVDKDQDIYVPIESKWVRLGISIGWVLFEHAKTTYGSIQRTSLHNDLLYIVSRLKDLRESADHVTISDLGEAVRSRATISTKASPIEYVKELVEVLRIRHILRVVPQDNKGGKPRSPLIELNPAIHIGNIGNTPDDPESETFSDISDPDANYEEEERKALQELT